MGQLKSTQIVNNTITGASFIRSLKVYDETESLSASSDNLRYFNGKFYYPINNITGVKENDLSQTPDISSDWIEAAKRFKTIEINSNYTSSENWEFDVIICDTSSGNITLTFPNNLYSSILKNGEKRFIFNTGNNTVEINTNTLSIDGETKTLIIAKKGYLELEYITDELKIIRKKNVAYRKKPDDIPNLELWLDASTLSGSNGSDITTWNDLSSNGYNFTGSAGTSPVLQTANQNGLNTASFDGSDDVLSAGDVELHNNSRGLTMVAVVKPLDSNRRAILSKYLTTNDNREFDFGNGANYLFEDLTWTSATTYTVSLLNNQYQVYTVRWKPGEQFKGYVNGNLSATGDNPVTDMSDGTANLKLGGGDYTGVGYWNGEIAEVAVYSDYVSDSDLYYLMTNLSLKWDLNLDISTNEDVFAIHTNKSSEIDSITEKTLLTNSDIFVIEDSEDSFNKKKVSFDTILKGSSVIHLDATSGSASISELNHIYYIQASGTLTTITIPDSDSNNIRSWLRIFKESGTGKIEIKTTSNQNISNASSQIISNIGEGISIKSVDTNEWFLLDDSRSDIPIYISSTADYLETETWKFDTLEFSISSDTNAVFRSDLTSFLEDGEKRFIFNPSSNDPYKVYVKTNGNTLDDSQDTVIIKPDGYLEFEKVDGQLKIIRSKNTYRGFSIVGTGTDGDLIVNSSTVVNVYTTLTGNTSSGSSSLTVTDASNFSVGMEILIHQTQDANYNQAGIYEFANIQSISGNTLTLVSPITNSYYSGTFGGLQNEATQIVSVPNYNSVDIQSGGKITSTPWVSSNGYGGIVAFRVKTDLIFETGNLGIDVSGQGFKGGEDNGGGNNAPGDPGESEIGYGWQNDSTTANCNPNGSGGGGGYGPSGYGGTAGGGGGHLVAGGDAVDGNSPPAIAKGGNAIGDEEMTVMLFGGAGGGGGDDDNQTTPGAYGGNSGGIIYIAASSAEDVIAKANGEDGVSAGGQAGGDGGGGAGGSIYIQALTFSKDTVEATGGIGGSDASGDIAGNGSNGIINIPASVSGAKTKLLQLVKSNSQAIGNGIDTYITWDTDEMTDSAFSWSGDTITFNEDGIYQIQVEATAELVSGTTRSTVTWRLQFDNSGSFSTLAGTMRGSYHRTNGNDINSISITKLVDAVAGSKIRLVAVANQNNLQTYIDGCHMVVEKK